MFGLIHIPYKDKMNKVVVAITTYNLEKYVEQCLDSVLNQVTDFEYKVIVADDCSEDKTLDILTEYKKRYPEKLSVLTTDFNMGSLANSNRIFDGLQSEYFSFIDGDDYWVSDRVLQKQVDFLDKNSEYMMCAGNTQYLMHNKLKGFVIDDKFLNRSFTFEDFIKGSVPFIHTSSIMVRNKIFINGLPKCYHNAVNTFENCALRGEDFRRILHLERGPIFVFKDTFSVYRIHDKGIWQGSSEFRHILEGAISANFRRKYFANKYNDFFSKEFNRSYKELMKILVLECGLLNRPVLDKKDAELFSGLISDICANNDFNYAQPCKIKREASRFFYKLLRCATI